MNGNAREVAMQILVEINKDGAYSNISLRKHIDESMSIQDEGLIRELVYGVLENKIYIDYILSKVSKIKIKKIHFNIIEILRLGIYQIIFMDRIPESAAVNEAVNLAKKYGHKGTIGFVNGVLRNIIRNKEELVKVQEQDKISYISIKYSHPKYLVERWVKEYGVEFTEELCKANNTRPDLNLRVNRLKINQKELINRLIEYGYNVRPGNYAKDCIIVENPYRITELKEFKEGYFTIQDESSILVGQVLDPKKDSLVLDVCSAPGGKSTHIGEIMGNEGKILSRDIYKHKLELVKENANRLGVNIINTQVYDALNKDKSLVDMVDYCLVDAPCSGFGLIRRKPEIKWNRKEKDISQLAKLQKKILDNVKDYLKIGGVLVYTTCTIEKEENINVINNFLKENPNFQLVNIEDKLDNKEKLNNLKNGYIELFPHIHGTDGFFIAKIIRKN